MSSLRSLTGPDPVGVSFTGGGIPENPDLSE